MRVTSGKSWRFEEPMPVRIVLAGILAALCALAGRTAAAALARRKRVLSSALAALEPLKIRMLHRRLPLEAALCESEDALLRLVGEAMPGKTALEAWDAVRIRQTKRGGLLDSLAREDCAALRAFFAQLGESGAREQEALFARTAEELGALSAQADKSCAERTRLYTSLGALLGAALAILAV